jgi:hypothetical protein
LFPRGYVKKLIQNLNMKGSRFGQDRKGTEPISSTGLGNAQVNVEFNNPLSSIKVRCEKENYDDWDSYKV